MTKEHPALGRAALAATMLIAFGAVASASEIVDQNPTSLELHLAAEQAQLDALKQQLNWDGSRVQLIRTAGLFGPSDEEKAAAAAAAQREQMQDSNIAGLSQRAGDIEDQIRKLTGQLEVLNHRLDEIDQRIDRMKKEFDYRLCAMSAQQLATTTTPGAAPEAIPCSPNGQAPMPTLPVQPDTGTAPPTGVTHLAPPPGVLGTLPQNTPMPLPAEEPSATPPATSPSMAPATGPDPHAQFDAALKLLAASQYDEARSAFRAIADGYPKDPLAGQALYWIGDIAYVQKDYTNAAHAFVEELKKFPAGLRAPESMLRLGQSLLAMNQKEQGCTMLHALPARYPSASRNVLAQAEAVRKAGGCRR